VDDEMAMVEGYMLEGVEGGEAKERNTNTIATVIYSLFLSKTRHAYLLEWQWGSSAPLGVHLVFGFTLLSLNPASCSQKGPLILAPLVRQNPPYLWSPTLRDTR
jgi:hypothetical protein